MIRRTGHIFLIITLLAAAGCNRQPARTGEEGAVLVPLQIALRVGGNVGAPTRGNPSVITEMDQTFRGINEVTVVPFGVRGEVSASHLSLYHPSYLSEITPEYHESAVNGTVYVSGLVHNNNAHLYSNKEAYLPEGTASVLFYGRPPQAPAATESERNHLNGALSVSGLATQPTLRFASDISFSPVPIYDAGIPVEASAIAAVMNGIAEGVTFSSAYWYQVHGIWHRDAVTLSWNDAVQDTWLRELFLWFTNDGNLTSGTGPAAEYMITRLYRTLKEDYVCSYDAEYEHVTASEVYTAMKEQGGSEPLTYADLYYGMRDEIVSRIETLRDEGSLAISSDNAVTFADQALRSYPYTYGLPDGAAIIRWTGIAFEPVSQTLDGVAPMAKFCYPPEIWYFVNTTLSTSTREMKSLYTSDHPSWKDDILPEYRSGKVLRSDTKSAALDSALQYSSAMLVASVRTSSLQLDDADDLYSTQVTVGTTNLPVTGVIIGSQRRLSFDFTPSGTEDYFLYDNKVGVLYLTKTELETAPKFKTLVSQTPVGQPVYFCLELRNDSGGSFTGADGLVLPGAKFYLVGSIELPTDHTFDRVFERDHATTVNCLVTSLADARTAIPDLEHPHLSVGLRVDVNWKESTPASVILY